MRKTIIAVLAFVVGGITLSAQETIESFKAERDRAVAQADSLREVISKMRERQKGEVHLDFDIPFYRKVRRPRAADVGSIGAGVLVSESSDALGFSPQNSLEFWGFLPISHTKGRHTLTYGPGIGFKNFGITGNKAMIMTEDGGISIGRFKDGAIPRISRLTIFNVNMPLLYSLGFGKGYGITLGPVVNLNASSSIINKYTIDGDKRKDKYKYVHCNLVTVDAMIQLNLRDVSVYGRYSPMNVMDKKYWSEFSTWSVGIAVSLLN
jgi:hypothetical protein